ncbi:MULTISPECIES: hypothetical protein [unclassified Paraburkholderia]|uniref:hypothetical protein n=1 Tax=unclassified Paraburkholderia TaxID=2615204 RepID=UPI002AB2AC40|nr:MULTISPECIES: hypothetical protein [unclassified Paraburkholderia]
MNTIDEEQLALERSRARFEADLLQTIRVIAERYHATGATLNGDAARAMLDEAFADVGLASRWPAQTLVEGIRGIQVPDGDEPLTDDAINALGEAGEVFRSVFGIPALHPAAVPLHTTHP